MKASLAGALFALGWFVFFDGIVSQARLHRLPATTLADWLPGAVATLGFSAMLVVPIDPLAVDLGVQRWLVVSERSQHCASCALFAATTLSFSSVLIAVARAQTSYIDGVSTLVRSSADYSAWPALAALIQSTAIVVSATLILYRRLELRNL